MKANELRIGNLAYHSELGIVEISSIRYDYIDCLKDGERYCEAIGRFSPILITEERLLKFGFDLRKEYNGCAYILNGFEVWIGNGWDYYLYSVVGRNEDGINEPNVEMRYIHQLQNLYFALTGEELTIKEPAIND